MKDKDFWKRQYADKWDFSSVRESNFKEYIEKQTGFELRYFGEGAGSTEFLHGSAEDNGSEKGAPDLWVVGTDIYIEVTGSFSPNTKAGDDIWFRPDKLNYAYNHLYDSNEFLANNFAKAGEWYVIHYDDELQSDVDSKRPANEDYQKITAKIRGVKETYISIHSNNPNVKTLDDLIAYLRSVKENMDHPQKTVVATLRHIAEMSQSQFAQYFGIPLATIHDWEHKRRKPPIYVPNMMLRILRVEMPDKQWPTEKEIKLIAKEMQKPGQS